MDISVFLSFHVGLFCEINGKKFDLPPSLHNTTSTELMDKFECICLAGFIGKYLLTVVPCKGHLALGNYIRKLLIQ